MRKQWILIGIIILLSAGCQVIAQLPAISPSVETVAGDPTQGEQYFLHGKDGAPPCSSCHLVAEGGFGFSLGPSLAGIAGRASGRQAGLSAESYLHESIVDPRTYIVSGYRDLMYTDYSVHLTEQDIADLVAYLMTLE